MEIKNMHIIALAAHGQGLSGSDRIFIEFARRWSRKTKVNISVCNEGYTMCMRHKLQMPNIKYQISNMEPWKRFGFVINYCARIIAGIRLGLTAKTENSESTVIYSASEFWMDSIPALILKLRFSKIKWVAAWYQTAPKPWKGFSEAGEGNRYIFKALLYWLAQLPIKPAIANFADYILVNNASEKRHFYSSKEKDKAIVVLGAVDLKTVERYRHIYRKIKKIYDGVFQGRFHPQKGVLELIDIWRLVVDKENSAKLVMIGDGPLMKDAILKIKNLRLSQNVILTGYLFDGPKKFKIFAQSRLVLHPSFYDSGGMAAGEAMAFGLPCIGFDLNSYKLYYPKGMIKVGIGNLEEFANAVISLLNNQLMSKRIAAQGQDMIKKHWSWDKRTEEILNEISR